MKTLQDYITEQLNEAVEAESIFEIKDGKNIYNGNAKKILVKGSAKYAEVYINGDSKVESIDFSGAECQVIRIDVIQCNKVKDIVGGNGDKMFCCIRKNSNLESLKLSGYKEFSDGKGGQVSYIDKNKKLSLSYDDLPQMVDAKHGIDIDCNGLKILRSNGVDREEKLKDVK